MTEDGMVIYLYATSSIVNQQERLSKKKKESARTPQPPCFVWKLVQRGDGKKRRSAWRIDD